MNTPAAPSMLVWIFIGLFVGRFDAAGQNASAPASEEGIAVAIVYDTSGSMLEQVRDTSGKMAPKYQIASRALGAIIDRLEAIVASAPKDKPKRIYSGLVIFNGDSARSAVNFGLFNAQAMRDWLKSFSRPQGSTPLGEAVRLAGEAVLVSKLSRKHVLVLTDGMNTKGPDPSVMIPKLNQEAARKGASVFFHFVALDVDEKAFANVKKLGATVVGAADEKQLNSQLEFILQEKILLEEEEIPSAKEKKK
jgi:Mg-chelatase subunit ChlD